MYHNKDALDIIVSISAFLEHAVQRGACLIVYFTVAAVICFREPGGVDRRELLHEAQLPFQGVNLLALCILNSSPNKE